MNLRKIAIGTIACSALLFASCAKSLSYKEAKDWVSTHYTNQGVTYAKSGKMKMDFSKITNEDVRAFLKQFLQLDDKFVLERDLTGEELKSEYLNGNNFEEAFGTEEEATKGNFTFSLKGDELSGTMKVDKIEGFTGGTISMTATFNKDGLNYKAVGEVKEATMAGAPGALNCDVTAELVF